MDVQPVSSPSGVASPVAAFPLAAFRHVLRANCLVKAQRLVSGSLYLLDGREVGHISFRFPNPVPVPMGVWQ